MRTIASLLTALTLIFTSPALAAPGGTVATARPGVIVIGDDDGGRIDDHVRFFERILQSGVPVRVEGICISACTLVLMLPVSQVCFTDTAALGFHLANAGGRPEPELTEILQRRYYPPAVQVWLKQWVERNGPLTIQRITYLSARDLIATGAARLCAPDVPVEQPKDFGPKVTYD